MYSADNTSVAIKLTRFLPRRRPAELPAPAPTFMGTGNTRRFVQHLPFRARRAGTAAVTALIWNK